MAELSGEVVGTCQLVVFRHLQATAGCVPKSSRSTCTRITVAGEWGARCIHDAVARARALGCYRVQLTSNTARPDAHRFYERLGFVPSHIGFKLPLE